MNLYYYYKKLYVLKQKIKEKHEIGIDVMCHKRSHND